jgi:hypothetical protein
MERSGEMTAKRIGRPKVAASKRRDIIFRFVATKEEATRIREAARGYLTVSDYIRDKVIPQDWRP